MRIGKVLRPGQPGTKKYVDEFGDKLVCVRYRYHPETRRRQITVELLVTEDEWRENPSKTPGNKKTLVRIAYQESYLRSLVKSVGGKWNKSVKAWEVPLGEVISLGLQNRIIEGDGNDRR